MDVDFSKGDSIILERTYPNMKRYFGFLLLAAGFGLTCAGLARGEAMLVVKKAITLCLECIGIG